MSTLTRTSIIEELEATLKSDKRRWRSSAFDRAVSAALVKLSYGRPLTATADITLMVGVQFYDVPDDFIAFDSTQWGKQHIKPWDPAYPGVTPSAYVARHLNGLQLGFSMAPSAAIVAAYGANFNYLYKTLHILTDEVCTVSELDTELLMTACQMQLIKELVASHVTEPVQMHNAMSDVPREATPVVAYQLLEKIYRDLLHDGYRGIS